MRFTFLIVCVFFISRQSLCQKPESFSERGYEFLYSHRDSSYHYFNKAIKGFQNTGDLDNELATYFGLLYANGYHYDLRSYKKNLESYEERVNNNAKHSSSFYEYFKDRLYLEKINYNFKVSDYSSAQNFIDSLSDFQNDRSQEERDADYYDTSLRAGLFQGSIYTKQDKLHLALAKYNQLEGFILQHKDSLYDYKNSNFSVKRLKAKAYASLGQVERAILSQIDALSIIDDDISYTNSRLDIELDLVSNLIVNNELEDAKELVSQLDTKKIEKTVFKIRLLDQKISLARSHKDISEGRRYHAKKIMEIAKYRNGNHHPDLVEAYIQLASDELYWGDIATASKYLREASSLISQMSVVYQSFTISKLQLDLAKEYLRAYILKGVSKDDAQDIFKTTQDVITSLDELQPQFESRLDKQYLINNAYPALQAAFVLMYNLYNATNDCMYLDRAFFISEKSKAIELRAIRQAAIAQQSLEVDPEIIERERLFNYTINQLEKDIFTNIGHKQLLMDSLLIQKEAYRDFVSDLQASYPEYYNLRYKNEVSTLSESMSYLENKSTILSFFQVDETMYCMNINREAPAIVALPFALDMQQKIRDYYQAVSTYARTDVKGIDCLGATIYKDIVSPIFSGVLPESLVIIPDGLLFYLPFEALVFEDKYLIENVVLSYKPSVSFGQSLQLEAPIIADFVGFAPSFKKENPLRLSHLTYNEEEIEQANSYYNGVLFKGAEGSIKRFRESVQKSASTNSQHIYHFATHAIANDTLPEYSYLTFSPEGNDNDFVLYAKDLYTEDLNAAMVVLSACETGLGKLQNGQGMQSLAQGFTYGGASSLVYSKWSVSDKQTSVIMMFFYKYLSQGLRKDKALQKAKLEYLSTVDDPVLKHPFYWASFVFSGDSVPLVSAGVSSIWIWLVIIIFVIAITFFIVKRINR